MRLLGKWKLRRKTRNISEIYVELCAGMSSERTAAESFNMFHNMFHKGRKTEPARPRDPSRNEASKSSRAKINEISPWKGICRSTSRHHVTTSPRRANVSNECVPTEIGTSKHFETLRNTSSDVTEAAIKSQSKERSSISLLCVLSTWNCCILGILGWDVQLDSQVPKRHGCNGSRAQFDKQDGLDLDSLDSLDKHLSETDL